ncbi:type II toxin-antitoxin system RelE/ParE family toxin [Polaribacter cellanae]|uniref:Type II toxin-antitoxin system RelE/ParE family toxin n=1 Tax=Polaribacter cellanae TaxID=2818493 RepID=A0A975CNJ1_9FLAO|nr:type II toxin-antitoxin system RelE/ParE family toxin [Polaribacter cellanae]QTE22883.1 type II toxin-antitoxin system RelE/ParE family toxin [Polaribacter cellanae]
MEFYNIISSKLSDKTYQSNIEYLEELWTIKEVINFIKKTEEVITILKTSPRTFKKYKNHKSIHQIVIVKQITLFYEINEKNVHLLFFFNNYQDPNKIKKLLE